MTAIETKAVATIAAAVVCCLMIHHTKGKHGAGWFMLALMAIW